MGAGTSTITASQAGNASFAAAADVTQTLTVNKAPQTVTFAALSAVAFGVPDIALTATASSGLPVSYTSSDVTIATIVNGKVHIVGAGIVNITASQAGDTNFNAATDVIVALTVNKITQTITFAALGQTTYGSADITPGATASSGLAVTYTSSDVTVATIVNGLIHIVGAGTVNITASQPGNTNINAAADVIRVLTVNKAAQTISFAVLNLVPFWVS